MTTQKKLPLGLQDFEEIITQNYLYPEERNITEWIHVPDETGSDAVATAL